MAQSRCGFLVCYCASQARWDLFSWCLFFAHAFSCRWSVCACCSSFMCTPLEPAGRALFFWVASFVIVCAFCVLSLATVPFSCRSCRTGGLTNMDIQQDGYCQSCGTRRCGTLTGHRNRCPAQSVLMTFWIMLCNVVGTRRIDGRVPFTICQPFPGFWHEVDTTSTRVCGWGGVGHVNAPCTLHTLLMFRSLQDVGQGLGWGGAC